jgi:hypothetical protein
MSTDLSYKLAHTQIKRGFPAVWPLFGVKDGTDPLIHPHTHRHVRVLWADKTSGGGRCRHVRFFSTPAVTFHTSEAEPPLCVYRHVELQAHDLGRCSGSEEREIGSERKEGPSRS